MALLGAIAYSAHAIVDKHNAHEDKDDDHANPCEITSLEKDQLHLSICLFVRVFFLIIKIEEKIFEIDF